MSTCSFFYGMDPWPKPPCAPQPLPHARMYKFCALQAHRLDLVRLRPRSHPPLMSLAALSFAFHVSRYYPPHLSSMSFIRLYCSIPWILTHLKFMHRVAQYPGVVDASSPLHVLTNCQCPFISLTFIFLRLFHVDHVSHVPLFAHIFFCYDHTM